MDWSKIVKGAYEFFKAKNIQQPTETDIKFMRQAYLVADEATNCRTKVGCVLVKDGQVLASTCPVPIPGVPIELLPNQEPGLKNYEMKYDYTWFCESYILRKVRDNGYQPDGCTLYKTYGMSPNSMKQLLLEGVKDFVLSVPDDPGLYSDNMIGIYILAKHHGASIKLIRCLTEQEIYGTGRKQKSESSRT